MEEKEKRAIEGLHMIGRDRQKYIQQIHTYMQVTINGVLLFDYL